MNSSDLFAFGISGSQTEQSIGQYQAFVNQSNAVAPSGISSWLKDKVDGLQQNFVGFVNSRLWEYSTRLLGEGSGEYVGRFDIGYLRTIEGLQSAEGLMQNYIMANPNVMKLYQDDIIEGYGGNFSPLCKGIGRDNLFFRQATNGVARQEGEGEDRHWLRTHFQDSIGNALSFRERVDIHKTWAAVDHHIATTYLDITSPLGKARKDHETETKEM